MTKNANRTTKDYKDQKTTGDETGKIVLNGDIQDGGGATIETVER